MQTVHHDDGDRQPYLLELDETLALSPMHRLAQFAPLVGRVIVGLIMAAYGLQKLLAGPANFGGFLAQLGVPAPTLTGYVVTLVELGGGILLIIGLFSRL